ncbi:hypothetical protein BX666DRAFT_1879981 [Dichotomocladium elegans]|nr:hypothetical protein BX666DRAFT_1879981 [Dichotomocladium elegans]
MVPLYDNVSNHTLTPSSLDTEYLDSQATPRSITPSLSVTQAQHDDMVFTVEEESHDESDSSISDSQEASLTTDDDEDEDDEDDVDELLLPEPPLALQTGNRGPLPLQSYHTRLHREYSHKRPSSRWLRLQEVHRLGMLKRRIYDLQARNGELKHKVSTLQVQRDAVALQELQDRERLRQLEEQLAALRHSLNPVRP